MSLEHRLIPAGEQHVVANWEVLTLEALHNLTVFYGDIGKIAWLKGTAHYVLANSDPVTWEALSPATSAIESFDYGTETGELTIGVTHGDPYVVTLPIGITNLQVATAITDAIDTHKAATDPHGDRSYADTLVAARALASITISGTAGRIEGGGSLEANRSFDLAAVGTAGSAGSTSKTLAITVDAYGRITSYTASDIAIAQNQVTSLVSALAAKSGVDLCCDRVATGGVVGTGSGLSATIAAGTAYVAGNLVTIPATTLTLAANTDNYIDLTTTGAITNVSVANGGTPAAASGGALRFARFGTGASTVTSATNFYNLGVGLNSLRSIVTGSAGGWYNTAVGQDSGKVLTTATYSALMGYQAGTAITTGSGNAVYGALAGKSITNGSYNTIVGYNSGSSITSGSSNVAVGQALHTCTTGSYNVAIGVSAGVGATATNENTTVDTYGIFIGASATRDSSIPSTTVLTNFGCMGFGAKVSTSNTFILGANWKVGINMTTATASLHLPAGTTSANSAPLKLTSGSYMSTSEAGSFGYIGTELAFTLSDAVRRRVVLSSSSTVPSAITVTYSSGTFTYQNTTAQDKEVLITGGTVTLIEFSRNGSTWYAEAGTSGKVWLSPNDSVRITGSGAVPSMTLIPR